MRREDRVTDIMVTVYDGEGFMNSDAGAKPDGGFYGCQFRLGNLWQYFKVPSNAWDEHPGFRCSTVIASIKSYIDHVKADEVRKMTELLATFSSSKTNNHE